MLSSFRYFEPKQLTLGGTCYLSITTLMCVLYLVIDSPKPQSNINNWQHSNYSYGVRYELSKDITSTMVSGAFTNMLATTDMTDLSVKLECDADYCFIGFSARTNAARVSAQNALDAMRNLAI